MNKDRIKKQFDTSVLNLNFCSYKAQHPLLLIKRDKLIGVTKLPLGQVKEQTAKCAQLVNPQYTRKIIRHIIANINYSEKNPLKGAVGTTNTEAWSAPAPTPLTANEVSK